MNFQYFRWFFNKFAPIDSGPFEGFGLGNRLSLAEILLFRFPDGIYLLEAK
ncbi:MAG: hypothetical protein ACW98D_20460 [Promethearchaeota archaeon]